MNRLLWSTLAIILLIFIIGPCLTFYLLLKDYWTEVSLLRSKLNGCQVSPSFGHFANNRILLQKKHVHSFRPQSSPLISGHLTTSKNESDFRQQTVQKSERIVGQVYDERNESSGKLISSTNQKTISTEMKTKSPHGLEVASLTPTNEVKSTSKIIQQCQIDSYVKKLERFVLQLSRKFRTFKECLDVASMKGSCGSDQEWTIFEDDDKLLRKKIRKHRKRRKHAKGGHKNGSKMAEEPSAESSPIQDLNDQLVRDLKLSADARLGVNHKISKIGEELLQFTETQSAFCKALSDNLGDRLGRRGKELESLSEQITALVRTTTSQVAMLEKVTSDQVYAGQTNIEKNLEQLQMLKDKQTLSIQDFSKHVAIPAMVTVTSTLVDQASSVATLGTDLVTKVKMLQNAYLTFATKQNDALKQVSEGVDIFTSKHNNFISRFYDHLKHLHINNDNFIRELQSRVNSVVKEMVMVRLQSQSFLSVEENSFYEITKSLNQTNEIVRNLSRAVGERTERVKEEGVQFGQDFREGTNIVNSKIDSIINQVLSANHHALSRMKSFDSEMRKYSDGQKVFWNDLYANQEKELRQNADALSNNLRSHNHHTQSILTGLQGTAETHEQVLEQQRMDYETFIRRRQDALNAQCSSISDWASLMISKVKRRDDDWGLLKEELYFSPVSSLQPTRTKPPNETLSYNSSDTSSNFQSQLKQRKDEKTEKLWMKKANSKLKQTFHAQIFTNISEKAKYEEKEQNTV